MKLLEDFKMLKSQTFQLSSTLFSQMICSSVLTMKSKFCWIRKQILDSLQWTWYLSDHSFTCVVNPLKLNLFFVFMPPASPQRWSTSDWWQWLHCSALFSVQMEGKSLFSLWMEATGSTWRSSSKSSTPEVTTSQWSYPKPAGTSKQSPISTSQSPSMLFLDLKWTKWIISQQKWYSSDVSSTFQL